MRDNQKQYGRNTYFQKWFSRKLVSVFKKKIASSCTVILQTNTRVCHVKIYYILPHCAIYLQSFNESNTLRIEIPIILYPVYLLTVHKLVTGISPNATMQVKSLVLPVKLLAYQIEFPTNKLSNSENYICVNIPIILYNRKISRNNVRLLYYFLAQHRPFHLIQRKGQYNIHTYKSL